MKNNLKETHSAGGVVLNKHGYVLVVDQNGNSWSLPKGHVEKGETTRETAEREINEESGLTKLNYVKNLGEYKRYKIGKDGGEDQSELKTITMFLYTTREGSNPRPAAMKISETLRLGNLHYCFGLGFEHERGSGRSSRSPRVGMNEVDSKPRVLRE